MEAATPITPELDPLGFDQKSEDAVQNDVTATLTAAPDPANAPLNEADVAAADSGPATAEASSTETASADAALPVPVGEPKQRRSLWRRITRRGEPRTKEPASFQDLVKSRLDGITLRLESFEHGLARSDARLESRFALLDRIETRLQDLADLGERADQARDAAEQAAQASRSAAQTARIAAGLAGVAVVIALTALLVTAG